MSGANGPGVPSGAPGPTHRRLFRAPSGTIGLAVGGVIGVILLIDVVVRAGWLDLFLLTPWVLLVLWGVYVLTFASHVATDSHGVTVQNLLRVTRVPWAHVTEIGMRYQVRFTLDDGSIVSAFGGPVAGRPARPGRRDDPSRARREPPALRDLELIREQWESSREDAVPSVPVRRSWDVPGLIAFAVIAVWAVSAVIIASGGA